MKEEILEYFKDINFAYNDCTRFDSLKRMLDELEQEPCDVSDTDVGKIDAVSRQAVLDKAVYTETENGWCGMTVDVKDIESLPSVTPNPKTGHWITDKFEQIICSECNGLRRDNRLYHLAYCNKCGAKW